MKSQLDSILLELVVTACQMDANKIWMQGDLEIRLNSKKPYADSDIINVPELLNCLEKNGEFFIFSCCCGIPECSGWERGIQVQHEDEMIKWTDLNNGTIWHFSKEKIKADLIDIQKEAANFKLFFDQKGIKYVGFCY